MADEDTPVMYTDLSQSPPEVTASIHQFFLNSQVKRIEELLEEQENGKEPTAEAILRPWFSFR